MPTLNLTNILIEQRTTIKGDTYFVIKDNDSEQAYFCFENKLKKDWRELMDNHEQIKEVEIEFEESDKGNRVVSLYARSEGDILI